MMQLRKPELKWWREDGQKCVCYKAKGKEKEGLNINESHCADQIKEIMSDNAQSSCPVIHHKKANSHDPVGRG